MSRRSRKTDPSRDVEPAPGPTRAPGHTLCDECGFPSDPYRGQLIKLWCHNRWRWLHWACRRCSTRAGRESPDMRRARPEDQVQRAVFEHMRARSVANVFAFHPANGGCRSRVEGKILKGLGVRAGVPDVIAVKDGRTYALEIKPPGGRLTAAQNAAHAALRAAGANVVTSYGLDDALAQLEAWGLLRGQADMNGVECAQ
jgi:hypothetical protein